MLCCVQTSYFFQVFIPNELKKCWTLVVKQVFVLSTTFLSSTLGVVSSLYLLNVDRDYAFTCSKVTDSSMLVIRPI